MSNLAGDVVSLIIPCRAEYVSVARLAMLGVANRLPFGFDEVEYLRLAVGEACIQSVERSVESDSSGSYSIEITCRINDGEFEAVVKDNIPLSNSEPKPAQIPQPDGEIDPNRNGFGALLMEILVDEVEVKAGANGNEVRLVKRPAVLNAVE